MLHAAKIENAAKIKNLTVTSRFPYLHKCTCIILLVGWKQTFCGLLTLMTCVTAPLPSGAKLLPDGDCNCNWND